MSQCRVITTLFHLTGEIIIDISELYVFIAIKTIAALRVDENLDL
jgi:hypothetical protein